MNYVASGQTRMRPRCPPCKKVKGKARDIAVPKGTEPVARGLMFRKIRRSVAMFWLNWDMAWSIVFGGIFFATIATRPDAKCVEVRSQSRAFPRPRDL